MRAECAAKRRTDARGEAYNRRAEAVGTRRGVRRDAVRLEIVRLGEGEGWFCDGVCPACELELHDLCCADLLVLALELLAMQTLDIVTALMLLHVTEHSTQARKREQKQKQETSEKRTRCAMRMELERSRGAVSQLCVCVCRTDVVRRRCICICTRIP